MTPDSILNVEVSAYPDYHTTEAKTINLLTFLQSEKHRAKVDAVRQAPDKEKRDAIKATLPAITPSGTFTARSGDKLTKHSGFIQFDIDAKENPGLFGGCETLQDYAAVIKELKNDMGAFLPFVAYAAASVSGRGVWGLIPLSDPTQHKAHFRSMQRDFAQMGIKIDAAPSSVASLRGYSYDPTAYFNHHADKYTGLEAEQRAEAPKIERPAPAQTQDGYITDQERVEKMVAHIAGTGKDITNGYENWFKIAGALSSAFGEWGRAYFHDLSRNNLEYDGRKTDKQFDACLRGKGYGIGTFYQVCEQHGFRYKEIVPLPERYDKLPGRIIQLPGQEGEEKRPAFDPMGWVMSHEYDPTKPRVQVPAVLSLRIDGKDYPILGKGMICAIVAEEKAGKTTLANAAIAAAISGFPKLNFFADMPDGIECFDTEQPDYWFEGNQAMIYRMAGLKEKTARYRAFPMRPLSPAERVAVIDARLRGRKDLSLVVIDGLVDLCTNFNDERAASETLQHLMRWSDETGAAIITMLHLTKGSRFMRGHLGSILKQKADSGIMLTHKEGEANYDVRCHFGRYAPFPAWSFYRDRDGMPCLSHPDALPERQDDPYPVPVQMSMPIVSRRNDDDDIPF